MTDDTDQPDLAGEVRFLFSTGDANIFEQPIDSFTTPTLFYWRPSTAPADSKLFGGFLNLEACLNHHREFTAKDPDNVIHVDFKAKRRI